MSDFCITVSNIQDKFQIDEFMLEKTCIQMLDCLLKNREIIDLSALNDYDTDSMALSIGILICNDEEIRELNLKYRGIDKPTDVLSFALFADSPENRIIFDNTISLGEVIISTETAIRQADENNKSFDQEINFLLSHGLLHLLGFDHTNDEELEYMLKIQDSIIPVK